MATKTAARAGQPVGAATLIIGVGASAGGLEAYKSFFSAMPVDTGMGFVLIQHLDPDYPSALVDIVGGYTAMAVAMAKTGAVVMPNTIWVIPPDKVLTIEAGVLRLRRPESVVERRHAVDVFLESLAQDQGDRAVGIILSGYGGDGTRGIDAIKEHGGLTYSEAEFDHHAKSGMPQSAVSGGFVDHVMPADEMAAALVAFQRRRARRQASGDDGGNHPDIESQLPAICDIVNQRTGRDFSQYKPTTMIRRIQRRMLVLHIDDPETYVDRLQASSQEPARLFQEILIGVTRFFRDPAAFDALALQVMPALCAGPGNDPIRIWVAGCSTGEEAYSIAILCHEALATARRSREVQIFATDIDDRAIVFARAGLYAESIATDVSTERLARHFEAEGTRFRVAKHIREMCLFSTHDLIKTPPFSRMGMVTCRNVLIYFASELQDRIITTFHFALAPKGVLFLGPSESVAKKASRFKVIDRKYRLYQRLDGVAQLPLPARSISAAALPAPGKANVVAAVSPPAPAWQRNPPMVIVDGNQVAQRFSGSVGKFFDPVSGVASLKLSSLLQAPLRDPAMTLLAIAASGNAQFVHENIAFTVDGAIEHVDLVAEPLGGNDDIPTHFSLSFRQSRLSRSRDAGETPRGSDADVDLTEHQQLQMVSEELETANEELQSSNEEFQSVNEELQSTNEELETSKEELQSINEELQTVNAELNSRNDSLVRSNSDLANLLDSTSVATLFLDSHLCIRRFTPAVAELFKIRDGDEGRPLSDIVSQLASDDLGADIAKVLRTLIPIERQIDRRDGNDTFLVRIRPYRDLNNVIDGVVIAFVDISERKRLEGDRARLAAIIDSSDDAVFSHDLNGSIMSWNAGAQAIYGYTAAEAMGQPMGELLAPTQRDEWPAMLERLRRGDAIKPFDVGRLTKNNRQIEVSLAISPMRDASGTIIGASAVARDVSDRVRAEADNRLLLGELDHRVKNILAIVASVVSQTLHAAGSPGTVMATINGRIGALANAQNVLTEKGGIRGDLRDLVMREMQPFGPEGGVWRAQGPDITLSARAIPAFALALHELATNAAKYGALSATLGTVTVVWMIIGSGAKAVMRLEWSESGGPAVVEPTHRGFGSSLIERSLVIGLDARVDRRFAVSGVVCTIEIAVSDDVASLSLA